VPASVGAAGAAFGVSGGGYDEKPGPGVAISSIPPLDGSVMTEDDFFIERVIG